MSRKKSSVVNENVPTPEVTDANTTNGPSPVKDVIEKIKNGLARREAIEITISEEYPIDDLDDVAVDDEIPGEDDYIAQSESKAISFIEMAMVNTYLHSSYNGNQKDFIVSSYGTTDAIGRLSFGGSFDLTNSYWFVGKFKDDENEYIFQPKCNLDNNKEMIIQLHMSVKKGVTHSKFDKIFKNIMSLAFNNSEFKGKCIKVKLKDSRFKGIEIINLAEGENELILNTTQKKFIDHFVNRVRRGKTARYLLNGEPGTGKTESIRNIARRLIPHVTFVIPEFDTSDDLNSILEACEIFERCVIIMDDIDLYLGSRDNGSYTRLLGQFLSFFDGVKKRKISLLASTNDKGLVDKAAERPGRFNFTLDFSFLEADQIIQVCAIHLPEKWRVDEVHEALCGSVNGKKINITGAFIANLADNIKEMSEDDPKWSVEDTVSLIVESYKGFYSSQTDKRGNMKLTG
jgi:hypothetical protein